MRGKLAKKLRRKAEEATVGMTDKETRTAYRAMKKQRKLERLTNIQ